MKENQKGSALLWAIALIMVLLITIAAALHLSYAYMNRSVQQNNERQAYLSAKGIIEDVVTKIEAGNPEYLALFKDLAEYEKTNLTIEIPTDLGEITANSYIEHIDDEETKGLITIQIEAVYLDATYCLKADMQLGNIDGVNSWQLLRYYQNEESITPSGNIHLGNTTQNEMSNLSQCWLTSSKNIDQCLADKMTPEELANVKKYVPSYVMRKNNDTLRTYFYYRKEPIGWEVFNKEETTNLALKDKLEKDEYYIQPYFTHNDYNSMIVYAKTGDKDHVAGFWGNVHLIFDEGHWYYISEVEVSDYVNGAKGKRAIMMTDFNNDTTLAGNTSTEKWARFKAKYLIPENILQ